jgi:hypothetical protein
MIKLGPEKAVYSVLLPEVKHILTEVISEYYIHTANKERLDKFRWDTIGKFKYWVKDIIDLSEFKHAYPVNGATGAIEQWLLDNLGNIHQLPGEYGWAKVQRPWIGDSSKPLETAYISNPFSATGSFHKLHTNIELPTLLDCAFIGSTDKKRIDITDNIKAIAFSFSKGFSVNLFRSGFLFSKDPIPALDVWLGFNYYNYVGMNVAHKIMNNFYFG